MTTVKGIVIKKRSAGEQDKFIDILTEEYGVIELTVKGAKKINGKSGSSTQLFAYSVFCYNQRKDYMILNSAEAIRIFYGLRDSLSKISLASYFADVLRFCIKPETKNGGIMRLFLNTLHYLEKNLRDEKMLKAIFELRLMSEIGLMPDVLACRECGVFEPEELFFSVRESCFCCKDCFHGNADEWYKVKISVLSAMRHILLSDFDRLYNFRTSPETMNRLSLIAENYLVFHLERNFRTLDFYKSLKL
ncbi:MAG: DNA repair protein RecO [Ruminococcus sp.]|nr:DNA repair protein RecO [Ruminococcus sp.]